MTRDDLPDGGASHYARTIREIKKINPETRIECLIPDFGGNIESLKTHLSRLLVLFNFLYFNLNVFVPPCWRLTFLATAEEK